MNATIRTILITGLALGLMALFLRNADLGQVWEAMRSANAGLLLLATLVTSVTYVVRTERWQYLLAPLGPTRFWVAFRTTVIGFAASALLPARVGEVVRPYMLARREGLKPASTFATIIVERILDLVAVIVLLAAYLLFFDEGIRARSPRLYGAIEFGGLVMTPVALGALLVMFFLAGHPDRLHAWVLKAERVLPGRLAHTVAHLARTLAHGFVAVRNPARLLASLGWSLVLWMSIGFTTWAVARAFDITMPYPGAFLLSAMLVVGIAIPTPGGVGGFHEAFRLGATAFFGALNERAVAAAIALHAISMLPVIAAGLVFVAQDGLNFGGLQQMARTARAEEETA